MSDVAFCYGVHTWHIIDGISIPLPSNLHVQLLCADWTGVWKVRNNRRVKYSQLATHLAVGVARGTRRPCCSGTVIPTGLGPLTAGRLARGQKRIYLAQYLGEKNSTGSGTKVGTALE